MILKDIGTKSYTSEPHVHFIFDESSIMIL